MRDVCVVPVVAFFFAFAIPQCLVAGPREDAQAAYQKGDYGTALRLWRDLAEQGDADSKYQLGLMYASGRGVAKDEAQAAQWFRKAAEQGNAMAEFNLGYMYVYGKGVTQDDAEAVQWYRRAAEQGNAQAQANLGFMHHTGRGTPQDDVEAVQWYRRSAEQGNAVGQNNLAERYREGLGVEKDDAQAAQWFRKAAEQGFAPGQRNLGAMYHEGRGVAKDDAAAVQWLQKASKQGDASAKTLLASIELAQTQIDKKDKTTSEREASTAATVVEPARKDGVPVTRAESASAGKDGLLIIHVDVARLTNVGETSWVEGAAGYYIKNLETGREYSSSPNFTRGVDAREVEAGIYCLESVKGGPNSVQLEYCLEPFFKVVPGKLNNAGWWRIGYSIDTGPGFRGTVRLVFGPKYFNEVLAQAKQYEKEPLRKYGIAVDD